MHALAFLTSLAITTSALAYHQPYDSVPHDVRSYGNLKPPNVYDPHLYARDAYDHAAADYYTGVERNGYRHGHLYAQRADADTEAKFNDYGDGHGHLNARYAAEPAPTPEEARRKERMRTALAVVHWAANDNSYADQKLYKKPTRLRQAAYAIENEGPPVHGTEQEKADWEDRYLKAFDWLAEAAELLPPGAPDHHNNDWVHIDAQLNRTGGIGFA